MSLVHKKNLIGQFLKSKMADRSEMARNAIQSEFFGHPKLPKAAILSKISKKIKLCIDLKWPEMRVNNVRTDCWLTTAINIYIHTDSYVGNEEIYIVFAPNSRICCINVCKIYYK